MGSMRTRTPRGLLGPDELRAVAGAFEGALARLGDAASHITPYSARRTLAFFIMDRALSGERDPARLRDDALDLLGVRR